MADKDFKFNISDECNHIFDEKGSMVLALRKVSWGNSEPKLELRKWFVNMEGETPSKGFTFLTEEGPHNLTETLVQEGYGDTSAILESLKDREDFHPSLNKLNPKLSLEQSINLANQLEIDDDDETDYYDPKEFLL